MDHFDLCTTAYTQAQGEAIYCSDKYMAVIAGPGSGKTRVLTQRIAHLIKDKKVSPDAILAVTFSTKAAGEIKKRLKDILANGTSLPQVNTFHSFGLRLIRDNSDLLGFSNGITVLSNTEKYKLLRKIIAEENKKNNFGMSLSPLAISEYVLTIGKIKSGVKMTDQDSLLLYKKYTTELKRLGYLDFDDMILLSRKLLMDYSNIREACQGRFKYILVDEAQDMNAFQTDIIYLIAGSETSLFIVGDDDQCIYEWRGAKPDFLSKLADNDNFKVIHLNDNFRSVGDIVSASSAFINSNSKRIPKFLFSRKKAAANSGAATFAYQFFGKEREAAFIADTIMELMRKGSYSFSDFAILVRRHKQASAIKDALVAQGIPCFEQIEDNTAYDEFLVVLRLLPYLRQKNNISRLINYPTRIMDNFLYMDLLDKFNIDANKSIFEVFEWLNGSEVEFENSELFRARFKTIKEAQDCYKTAPAALVIRIFADGYSQERKHIDKLHSIEIIANLASEFDSLHAPSEKRSSLEEFLDQLDLSVQEEAAEQPEEDAVNLMTCHRSKGLEFPVVFIPGVQVSKNGNGFLNPLQTVDKDSLEAERRLFYVSMTRASEKLYITCHSDPYIGSDSIQHGFLAELKDIVLRRAE